LSPQILKKPIEVDNRLRRLRTSREQLIEVAEAMAAAANECTANDPTGSRGWRSWQMGTRRNREIHSGREGWANDNEDQIPSILNEEIGVRIVVCNTDDGTCLNGRTPQNRSRKGPATQRLVDNNQGDLFEAGHIAHPDSVIRLRPVKTEAASPDVRTYMLCVFCQDDELRAELSFATRSSAGFFAKFEERIFISGGDAGKLDGVKRKESDDASEFEIPVKRKKSNS